MREETFTYGVNFDPDFEPLSETPEESRPCRIMREALAEVAPLTDDMTSTSMMMAVYYDRERKKFHGIKGFQGDVELIAGACNLFLKLANNLLAQADSPTRIRMETVEAKDVA